ncbi:MAG: hypothetical protein ACI4NW_07275 [Stenotrophomonas sp.]
MQNSLQTLKKNKAVTVSGTCVANHSQNGVAGSGGKPARKAMLARRLGFIDCLGVIPFAENS